MNPFIDFSSGDAKVKREFIDELIRIDDKIRFVGIFAMKPDTIHVNTRNINSLLFENYKDLIHSGFLRITTTKRIKKIHFIYSYLVVVVVVIL